MHIMGVGTWTTISRLLDDALDHPPSERAAWLDGIGPDYAAFLPTLRALLDRAGPTGDGAFLATLPKFDCDPVGVAAPAEWPDESAAREGTAVGPYRLVRRLASGGQGTVWLAERTDGLIKRAVAVKLPHGLAYRPGLVERMARERDILAGLCHPHIARLYDAGVTDDDEPYLALEYVDGTPIDTHVRDRDAAPRDRVRLFLQVVRAVAYAHGQLVIHRDLKPSNILVTPAGHVRLLDFGIAKLLAADALVDSTLTAAAGRALTLPYASPEQIQQRPLGVATDIYSLGVVLYELLTGVRPHRPARPTAAALEEAILQGAVTRPSDAAATPSVRAALAGDLDSIVLKALKVDPRDRYATADALADDLERALDGRPVLARPDSPAYRARKFVARHRVGLAVTAASIVAVLAGIGVAAWQAQVARRERDVAVTQQAKSEAVAGFLDWILQQASTDRPLTALELIERGVTQLEQAQGIDETMRALLRYEVSKHYLRVNQTDRELALLARSADGARRVGDLDLVAAAECSAAAAVVGRDLAVAVTRLAEGERALAQVDDPSVNARSDCLRAGAQVLAFQGHVDAAIRRFEAELPALPSARDNIWMRHGILDVVLTGLYRKAGRFQDAQRIAEATIETMRRKGQHGTMNEFAALGTVAANLYDLGEVRAALLIYRDLVQWFERGNFAVAPMVTLTNAGVAELRGGRAETALRLAEIAAPAGQRAGNLRAAAAATFLASRALLALGRRAEARAALDAAERFWSTNAHGNRRQLVEAELVRTEIDAADGHIAEALASVDRVLQTRRHAEQQAEPNLDWTLRVAARHRLALGDAARAEGHATAALDLARRTARDERASADVGEAALLRSQARAVLGHRDDAWADACLASVALTASLGPDHALTAAATALVERLARRVTAVS